jgi:hypothetical protein
VTEIVVEIRTKCCNRQFNVSVERHGYQAFQNGKEISLALPSLGEDEKRLIQFQVCAACWFNMQQREALIKINEENK